MGDMKVLSGRNALITGAGQGLGEAIARAFVAEGGSVFLCARTEKDLDRVSTQLRNFAASNQRVGAQVADVSCPDQVSRLVESALGQMSRLDILVNNAGVYGPMGAVESVDWDDWVSAIQINLFGSVLASRAVLPHFKEQKYGKILQLSGGGATAPLPYFTAYAASKAGIVRYMETLAEEVRDFRIDVNSIAPGALNTRYLEQVLDAGPDRVGQVFYQRALRQRENGGVPVETAARLAVFLASAASDGITGKLISAVWDPWEQFEERRDELCRSDVYTLRRVTPNDREARS